MWSPQAPVGKEVGPQPEMIGWPIADDWDAALLLN
jgi:hypothetical protein